MIPDAFVIASSAHASALRRRLEHDRAITVFSESEALGAFRVMLANPPKMLALDSAVVRTSRGAWIVSHLKEHGGVDLRVLTEDEGHLPTLLVNHDIGLHAASQAIDSCGTRGAPRFAMKPGIVVVVNGECSKLVNLSVGGAQLVLGNRVQPRQSVGVSLVDEQAKHRFRALVAWSAAELTNSMVKYRAGVSFTDPDAGAIEAFCLRHAVLPQSVRPSI